MEELVCFCGLWEAFCELRDPDNVWVSVPVAPIHTHKSFLLLTFHTVLGQTTLLRAGASC